MAASAPGSFWDAVRSWADSAGITVAAAAGEGPSPRASVPESVCASCPICQGAATLEQINPAIIDDLTNLAQSLVGGIGSALAAAAEQRHRLSDGASGPHDPGPGSHDGVVGPVGPEGDSAPVPDAGTDPLVMHEGPPMAGPEDGAPGAGERQPPSSAGASAPAA